MCSLLHSNPTTRPVVTCLQRFSNDPSISSLTPAVVDEANELLLRGDFDELYSLIGRVVADAPDHARDELFEAMSSALAEEELASGFISTPDVLAASGSTDVHYASPNSIDADENFSMALDNETQNDSSSIRTQWQPHPADLATQYDPIIPPHANLRSVPLSSASSDSNDDSDEELFKAVRELVQKSSDTQESIQELRTSLTKLRTQAATTKGEWEKAASNAMRQIRLREAELARARDELVDAIGTQNAIIVPEPTITFPGFVHSNIGLARESNLTRLSCFFPHARRVFEDPYFSSEPVKYGEAKEIPALNDDATARSHSDRPSRSMLIEAGSSYRKWREREREVLIESVYQVALQLHRTSGQSFSRNIDHVELAEMTRSWSLREWGAVRVRCGNRNASVLSRRSLSDIMCRYLNVEAPWAANRLLPWSVAEDEQLREAVDFMSDSHSWTEVALAVGNQRTPMSCLRRLAVLKSNHMLRGAWSAYEDSILVRAVALYGRGNWKHVALVVGMRDAQQCMNRFEKRLAPGRRTGKWSDNEVRDLLVGVHQYGENWVMVATLVNGRSDVQCREKYMNSLTTCAHRAQWKWKEDALLVVLVHTFGTKWSHVSSHFVSRSGSQCMRRWKRMQKYSADMRSNRGIMTGKRRMWQPNTRAQNKRRALTIN